MSYPTFVTIMQQNDIPDTSQAEYNAAMQLYIQDIADGETTNCFCEWLKDHINYNVLNGY